MNNHAYPRRLLIAVACAAALSVAMPQPVHAQLAEDSSALQRRKAERAKKEQERGAPAAAAMFPNATRTEPGGKAAASSMKALQSMGKAYEGKDYAGVLAQAVPFAEKSGNAYEKSYAYQLAGNAAAESGDQAKAADYFQKALDANGLDNNGHYSTMNNLMAAQAALKQNDAALATLDRFLAETKSDDPRYASMRASLLAATGKGDDAAEAYQAQLAKNPNDKRALLNAVAALQQAKKYREANALLDDARKRGMLTDASDYRVLYSGLLAEGNDWKQAKVVVEEGVAKGILPKDAQLAKAYAVIAQNAFAADDIKTATAMYQKAAPLSDNGEAYLNLAKVLQMQNRNTEAKAAAKQALEKGVKTPEQAKRILGSK